MDTDNIVVMYPGGFKPLTGAHIDLVQRYLNISAVKKVVLFISPSKREEIDAKIAMEVASSILNDPRVEIVLDEQSYSPILACYRWVEDPKREPGTYVLASSSKGDDYKRVKEFKDNYATKYKDNLPTGVVVSELTVDCSPLCYCSGHPISATRAREDIRDRNFEQFKDNYPQLNEDRVMKIWKKLVH